MPDHSPILLWLRRDLRLADHPALHAACATGRPVIPVFIRDEAVDDLGAAPKWRLGLGLSHFAQRLAGLGSALVLRHGPAEQVLAQLVAETGATAIYWSRLYDPQAQARDSAVKTWARGLGCEARSFGGHLMFEPWTVATKTGGEYKVYTPFWRAVRGREVDQPLPAPGRIPAPKTWPGSDALDSWQLGRAMQRGAEVVAPYLRIGEAAALARLAEFVDGPIARYDALRDIPAAPGTSGLSENLALGEISPHQCWHAALGALQRGVASAETFMKELVWREFAYHLMFHTPRLLTQNWKAEWDMFPWSRDASTPQVQAWMQGRTGVEFVDAAMREMYVTGRMHNRARMIVASYLCKHLLSHWQIGQNWFAQCLIDWDPAANAMGWQWAAGSGPDAAPYFRVFNPDGQRDKFDPDRRYIRRWIAEGQGQPPATALAYFDAVPRSWQLNPQARYPRSVVALDVGRKRALEAYAAARYAAEDNKG